MKKSLKGALLSGLVFPGFGQIGLKAYARGFALLVFSLGGLVVITMETARQASSVVEKLVLEGGGADMNALSNALAQPAAASSSLRSELAWAVFCICWIIGVVDAYMLGKKKDDADAESLLLH